MVVCTRTNMTADDHVTAFVRDGHIRQGDSAEDMMMLMLRCLRNEITCVGLEEYMYPNCLLAKAMKEGKMKWSRRLPSAIARAVVVMERDRGPTITRRRPDYLFKSTTVTLL